jgi:hypothetical protein
MFFVGLNTLPSKAVKLSVKMNNFLNNAQFMKNSIPKIALSSLTWLMFALAAFCSLQNSNAQTQPDSISSETTARSATPVTPPDILPTSPLAQVIRLTQAGVDQSVIMNYVTGSSSTFNLDSDKIIYLSDVGVPNDLVTAMMQRDQQLQQQFATAQATQQAQQTQPPQPAPIPETAPANPTDIAAQPETQPAAVTINYFNDTLTPYGNWVVITGYGRCWRPTVVVYNSSWQPYCDRGHWVYSDCGWYWASDYAWGATFHYGRWFCDPTFGWCWYPDTIWAPSWVTWRYSDNYCGWAPLPPGAVYQAGVGIVFNGGSVSEGFSFGLGANAFIFVPTQNFCDPHPRNYCVARTQVTQIYNNTTVINNYNANNRVIINHGIPAQHIANVTRNTIRPVPVHELNNYLGAYGRPNYAQGPSRPAFAGNFSSQPSAANQNHSEQPQRPSPTVNYHTPANYNQQSTPARWQDSQPTGTPRSSEHYSEAQQNYSEPAASSQAQPSSGHYGNQWPGH